MRKGDITVNPLSGNLAKIVTLGQNGELQAGNKTLSDIETAFTDVEGDITDINGDITSINTTLGGLAYAQNAVRVSTDAGYTLGTTGTYTWKYEDKDGDPNGQWLDNERFRPKANGIYVFAGFATLSGAGITKVELRVGSTDLGLLSHWSVPYGDIRGFIGAYYCGTGTDYRIRVTISSATTRSQSTTKTYNRLFIGRIG